MRHCYTDRARRIDQQGYYLEILMANNVISHKRIMCGILSIIHITVVMGSSKVIKVKGRTEEGRV